MRGETRSSRHGGRNQDSRSRSRDAPRSRRDSRDRHRGRHARSEERHGSSRHQSKKESRKTRRRSPSDSRSPSDDREQQRQPKKEEATKEASKKEESNSRALATVPQTTTQLAPSMPNAPVSGGVPDWLSDLFPQGQVAKQSVHMEVPLHLAPLLAADGQAALRRISQITGAEIALRQDMQHLGYSLAIITGLPDSISKTKELIMEAIGFGAAGAAQGGGQITKEVEAPTEDGNDTRHMAEAVDLALAELRPKVSTVQLRIMLPELPGQKHKIVIGPGPVAHVAVAEQLVQKKMRELALDRCYRQGRPVPNELKVPMICKFYRMGATCSLGGKCPYCHTQEELLVAKKVHVPGGEQVAACLAPNPEFAPRLAALAGPLSTGPPLSAHPNMTPVGPPVGFLGQPPLPPIENSPAPPPEQPALLETSGSL